MIERITQKNAESFFELTQAKNPFACLLFARLSAFGAESPYADFWLCSDTSGNFWGALGRTGSHFTLYPLPCTDFEELASFFCVMGQGALISAPLPDCRKLKEAFPLSSMESGKIMGYRKSAAPEPSENVKNSGDYKEIYRCICESRPEFSKAVSFDDFYAELYPKKKQNQCYFVEIRKNNLVISTAGALHLSGTTAVIGCVSTVPEECGHGYASQTIATVTGKALSRGLLPLLLCKKELVSFYERLGFTKENEWGQLRIAF